MGVTFAFLACLYVFCYPLLHGVHAWAQALDLWMLVDGGRYVAHGALPFVYEGSRAYALPLGMVFMAPASAVMDHWHLVEGAPHPLAHPSGYLIIFPWTLLWGIPLLHSVRRLAWELGLRKGLLRLQVLGAVIVLFPCTYWGHPEDILALLFIFYGTTRVLQGRFLVAGLLLSIAISCKQWAVVLLPFAFAVAPREHRVRVCAAGCALPAVLVGLTLGLDWHDAYPALFKPLNMGSSTPGHLSFFATWFGSHTSEYSRTLGVVVALPIALVLRRWQSPPRLLAALAVLLALRPFAEAISYSYYWAPAAMMVGLVGVAVHRRLRWQDWALPVLVIVWAMPRGHESTATIWWLVQTVLLALLSLQAATSLGRATWAQNFVVWQRIKNETKPPIMTAGPPVVGEASWIQ